MATHNAAPVQGRNLRRFDKLCWQKGAAAEYAKALKGETERLRRDSLSLRAYLDHFLANVWRTIHEEPKDKWPGIFGKLYADHFQGAAPPHIPCALLCNGFRGLQSTRRRVQGASRCGGRSTALPRRVAAWRASLQVGTSARRRW